jgi:hypothetical protein
MCAGGLANVRFVPEADIAAALAERSIAQLGWILAVSLIALLAGPSVKAE